MLSLHKDNAAQRETWVTARKLGWLLKVEKEHGGSMTSSTRRFVCPRIIYQVKRLNSRIHGQARGRGASSRRSVQRQSRPIELGFRWSQRDTDGVIAPYTRVASTIATSTRLCVADAAC